MGAQGGVGTVAFSVAFILILRRKVISVLVTRFDNICNNFIRLRLVLYEMKVEKTRKFFQSFGRLQLFGLRFVFPKFQSFGRPPVLAIPALTVLILTR